MGRGDMPGSRVCSMGPGPLSSTMCAWGSLRHCETLKGQLEPEHGPRLVLVMAAAAVRDTGHISKREGARWNPSETCLPIST